VIEPFHSAPGRDVSQDRPNSIDVPRFYFEQRHAIAEDAARLRALRHIVNSPADLAAQQWAQWYSVARGFRPDVILELGRGRGNSTALFTQAASRLPDTRVVSLCYSSDWGDDVEPQVRKLVEPGWLDRLDARRADILATDYDAIFGSSQRVLVLWDAHGFEIAEVVLGRILPMLKEREHLFLLHDISDNRYSESSRAYGGPMWKGPAWQERTRQWGARTNIGWMSSIQNQVIAVADFSARNNVELQSADHEYRQFFNANPEAAAEMTTVIGDEYFSVQSHWAYLSLSGKAGPFHFPADSARPACEQVAAVTVERVDPALPSGSALPLQVTTPPTKWLYGGVVYWRMPDAAPAAGAPMWLKLKIQVRDALAGIGLLNTDGSKFLETRLLTPSERADWIYLPIEDRSTAGGIALYSWDKGAPARIEVSEVSLVW
jgi:hypothetical protein